MVGERLGSNEGADDKDGSEDGDLDGDKVGSIDCSWLFVGEMDGISVGSFVVGAGVGVTVP